MSRDDERDSVIQFREDSAEMAVPGVTMHQIGIDVRCGEIDAAPHRAKSRFQRLRASETARVELDTGDLEISFFEMLIAKATDFDGHCLGQLAREITGMHARAAVNVRRIFVGEEKDLHCTFLLIACPDFSKRPACAFGVVAVLPFLSCRAESRHL